MRRPFASSDQTTRNQFTHGQPEFEAHLDMMPTRTQLYVSKSVLGKRRQGMFLASKTVETGIVFALLISGMSVARVPSFAADSELSQEALRVVHQNDVKKMQLALQDRGQYSGQVDGVMGLRTRASIRAFQKTENLPITGRLDPQTARKLGLRAESIRSSSVGARQDVVGGPERPGNQTTRGKPWAGTKLAKGMRRTGKPLPKIVPAGADPEGSQGNREVGFRAESPTQPR